jgi:transcriptional regulator with XRE-family HTH domain
LEAELYDIFLDPQVAARAARQGSEERRIFGRNLRQARITAGLTPGDIQDRAGVPREYVDQIEQGQVDFSLKTMVVLALAVDRDLLQLFDPSG